MKKKTNGVILIAKKDDIEWTDVTLDLLGTDTDTKIGAQLGISKMRVYMKRKQFGIAPFRKHREKTGRWTEECVGLLGKMSDNSLALKMGITREAVRQKRAKHKLPAYRKHE